MPVPKQYVIAEPWVIREAETGHFICGKTHHEPMQPKGLGWPRLFVSEASAKAFVAQWRRGKMYRDNDGDIHIASCPAHRKTTKFEYIQLQLVRIP